MSMTLQQLKIFTVVADTQNISAAARQLKLRQSTVHFHIKSLEESVGVPIFVRTRQRWELTFAGQELMHYAKTLLNTANEALRIMEDFKNSRERRLQIGTSHIPSTYIVPKVVHQFHVAFPDIQLEVKNAQSPLIRSQVEDRQLDVGFIIDAMPLTPDLESINVLEDEIGCVFSPSIGLQWLKTPITADQLQAIPLIGHAKESSTARVCNAWATSQNSTLAPSVILGSIDMIKTAVKLGMGAALMSKMMVYDEVERGALMYAPVHQPPKRQLRLIYHKDPSHVWLQDFVRIVQESVLELG